jgi:ribonuclease HII
MEVDVHRKYFMGVDEAGYGPNLGPLVVAASLWSAPSDFDEQHFAAALAGDFACRSYSRNCSHVPLGDSKQLFAPQSGLGTLEAGLLALLPLLPQPPAAVGSEASLGALLGRLTTPACRHELQSLAWYTGFEQRAVPHALTDVDELQRLAAVARQSLRGSAIELVDLQAEIVCEPSFNREVTAAGSKGAVLSRVTLELVVRLLKQCSTATEVFCDRQGGRKNYLPQLLAAMPDEWFRETALSSVRSSYRSQGARPIVVHFSVGGDSFPPTALASMLAKYIRERLMVVFNSFWKHHVADLKPTAGYPLDARRFRAAIEQAALRLNWTPDQWWRSK